MSERRRVAPRRRLRARTGCSSPDAPFAFVSGMMRACVVSAWPRHAAKKRRAPRERHWWRAGDASAFGWHRRCPRRRRRRRARACAVQLEPHDAGIAASTTLEVDVTCLATASTRLSASVGASGFWHGARAVPMIPTLHPASGPARPLAVARGTERAMRTTPSSFRPRLRSFQSCSEHAPPRPPQHTHARPVASR